MLALVDIQMVTYIPMNAYSELESLIMSRRELSRWASSCAVTVISMSPIKMQNSLVALELSEKTQKISITWLHAF